jgi:hypothetical protein
VRGEHDRRLVGGGEGGHGDVPGVGAQGVGHVGDDLAGEALLAGRVDKGEGDAVRGVGNDGPVAPVPAVIYRMC